MIECQRLRQIIGQKDLTMPGVIRRVRHPNGFGDIDRRHGVAARISAGIGIDSEQGCQPNLKPSLLPGFSRCGLFDGFADIDKSARNRPAEWRMSSLDQHDGAAGPVDQFDDGVGGERRGDRSWHWISRKPAVYSREKQNVLGLLGRWDRTAASLAAKLGDAFPLAGWRSLGRLQIGRSAGGAANAFAAGVKLPF